MWIAFIFILYYVNLIRFQELKENTSMFKFKQYLNFQTYAYNFTILLIWIGFYIIKITA